MQQMLKKGADISNEDAGELLAYPHATVIAGSHIFGEIFFKTKLLGSSTTVEQCQQVLRYISTNVPM